MMGLGTGVTVREVSVWYIFLARKLHPDKHNSEVIDMISEEAVKIFKLVNNAQQFLRDTISTQKAVDIPLWD